MTRRGWRKLRSPVVRFLPAALAWAVLIELGLRCLPLRVLARWLGVRLALAGEAAQGLELRLQGHQRLATADANAWYATYVVMRRWPFGGDGKCLRETLLAACMLRHLQPSVAIGVAKLDGAFRAHAWLLIDDFVLDATAGAYVPLRGWTG